MLNNYLKLALRNLRKSPLYTGLNIGGLALGIGTCLLIALFVRDELSYDRYNVNADRIFRVNSDIKFGGAESAYAVAPDPMGFTMKQDYPQIEEACRFRQMGFINVKKGETNLEEGLTTHADSTLFDVFTLPLLEGDPRTALCELNTVVITESMARKYFGAATGIVGRTLRINDITDYRVTGVLRDLPAQSHFHYDFFFPMANIADEANAGIWPSHNFQTYFLLRPGVLAADVEAKFPDVVRKYTAPQAESLFSIKYDDILANGDYLNYSLINVRDIHLHSDRIGEQEANGDIRYVWIFSAVALFILLLACINFMNLATARSSGRAREVGMRKVLGSGRSALVGQFMAESFVLTGLAFALAIVAAKLALPAFNDFADKKITFSLFDPQVLTALVLLGLCTALVAGSYPAFFLSAFRPMEVLKGKMSKGAKSGWLRSSLVVFQFCTSIALIISVLVVQKQLSFVQTKKLGFEKEQLVLLRNTWWLHQRATTFKEELLRLPGVASVTTSNYYPVPGARNSSTFFPEGVTDPKQALNSQIWGVDYDYVRTLGMEIVAGRDFDPALKTDSTVVVMNESAVRTLGWSDPIGRKITTFLDNAGQQPVSYTVVGVVKDFHYESLRQSIEPLILHLGSWTGMMGIRLRPGNPQPTLAALESQFHRYLPAQPFEYSFLDEDFGRMYRTEQRIGKILGAFAGFAIFIACLGLFGLAAFTTEQRTKEIGIRKVLGASVLNINGLLAQDFLKLVVIALALAVPLAWLAMQRWLEDFAYRTTLGWSVFALAGLAAVGIALLTVSFTSVKAALANPVKSLRSE